MSAFETSLRTRFRVGVFSLLALVGFAVFSVWVNHRPYWWKPCRLVQVHLSDATGLKPRSGVRSLGVEIGYLQSLELESHRVSLTICLTAPVDVLPETRAILKADGLLGDKFIELKPIAILKEKGGWLSFFLRLRNLFWVPEAYAEWSFFSSSSEPEKESPMVSVKTLEEQDFQKLIQRVDSIAQDLSKLIQTVQSSIDPQEIRASLKQMHQILDQTAKVFQSPKGLTQTAQRSLLRLEQAAQHLQELLADVHQGKGTVGLLLQDPETALQVKQTLQKLHELLSKASQLRFVVQAGAVGFAEGGGKGEALVQLWPTADYYYFLGAGADSRGIRTVTRTLTRTDSGTQTVVQEQFTPSGARLSAGFGRLFLAQRLDLSLGLGVGNPTVSAAWRWGPRLLEDRIQTRIENYINPLTDRLDTRVFGAIQVFPSFWFKAGCESFQSATFFGGAFIGFDDDAIRLLFALR